MQEVLQSEPSADFMEDEAAASKRAAAARTRLYAFGAVVLFLLSFGMSALSWAQFGTQAGIPTGLFTQTDFPAVVIASRLAASGNGTRLYDLAAQLEGQHSLSREGYLTLSPDDPVLRYPYPYTPFIALLGAPLAALDPLLMMALWDLLNLAAFTFGLWLLLRDLPLPGPMHALLLLGGLSSLPWIVNLEQGQSSGVIALGMALGVLLLRRGRDWEAGLALGLLLLKVQWLPLIALALLLKWRWRALVGLAGVGGVLVATATLALGPGWVPAYLGTVTSASRDGEAFLLTPAASHSLNGGIYALLGPGNEGMVGTLNLIGTLLVAALLSWAWLASPGSGAAGRDRWAWQPGTPAWDALAGLTLAAAVFTNPQLNTHDLSLLVLPAALGFAAMYGSSGAVLSASRRTVAWHVALWLLYFAPFLVGGLLDAERPLPVRLTTWLIAVMLVLLAAIALYARTRAQASRPI